VDEDWVEEEAETPYAWAESDDGEDESGPIRDYLKDLLGWGGGEAVPAEPVAAAPEPDESTSADAGTETVREEAAAPPDEGPPSSENDPNDDDDLDMFRSWLESLKQ
jgi:hypothetical protein